MFAPICATLNGSITSSYFGLQLDAIMLTASWWLQLPARQHVNWSYSAKSHDDESLVSWVAANNLSFLDAVLSSQTSTPTPLEWPCQEQRVSSTLLSDVSAPACRNRVYGVWPLLQVVNVAQKSKPSAMLPFTPQSIDLSTEPGQSPESLQ